MRRLIESLIFVFFLLLLFIEVKSSNFEMPTREISVDPLRLTLSLGVLCAIFVIQSLLVYRILAGQGSAASWRTVFYALNISNFTRYIPGRIWQLSSAIGILKASGVPISLATAGLGAASMLSLCAAALLGLLTAPPLLPQSTTSTVIFCIAVGIGGYIALTLLLKSFAPTSQFSLRLKLLREFIASFSLQKSFVFLVFYIGTWLLIGGAFFIFCSALYPLDPSLSLYLHITGVFALAYLGGYIAFFAPGGLGVRESLLTIGLYTVFPHTDALTISIFSRLWFITVEILMCVAAIVIGKPQ